MLIHKKVLFFLLISSLVSTSFASDRFEVRNFVKNGVVETSIGEMYDEAYYNPVSKLSNLPEIEEKIYGGGLEWNQVVSSRKCSDTEFERSFRYLQFLYFASLVSINFEFVLDLEKNINHINENFSCLKKMTTTLKECSSSTKDMQRFNLRFRKLLKDKYQNVGKSQKWASYFDRRGDLNVKRIQNVSESDITGAFQYLLKSWCDKRNHCSKNFLLSQFRKECDNRVNAIYEACAEKSHLIRYLKTREITNLIKRSSAIDYLLSNGGSIGCIDRYTKEYIRNVGESDDKLIRAAMRNLVQEKIPYLQGRVFVLGSLKAFDDLGIGNELFNEIKVAKKKERLPDVKIVKKVIKSIKKSKPKEIIKLAKKEEEKKPIRKPAKRQSAFKIAKTELTQNGLESSAVNMDFFKDDFIFSDSLMTKLHKPLALYQTQKALKEMKKYDGLGEKKTPLRLLFLKYLIDNNYHQGLYNIISVLGESFYIKNDIDEETEPYFIKIQNDFSTNNQWQIYVMKSHPSSK